MSSKRKTTDETALPSVDRAHQQGPGSSSYGWPKGSSSGGPRGGAGVKRQRVSRACDQCRAAREKCDGIQPLCFPCVSQNRPCTYQANPKKRGVPTGYIRTLELALAWVFEKVPGSEDALASLLCHEGGQGQRLLTGSDSRAANRLHQKWEKSGAHRAIDRILSGEECPLPRDDKSACTDDGTDSNSEVDSPYGPPQRPGVSTKAWHQQPSSEQAKEPSCSRGPSQMSTEQRSTDETAESVNQQPRTDSGPSLGLRLPPDHWRLMDIYFSYTHCWLPILEKQEMFQASYLYSAGQTVNLSAEHPSSSAHAELWSALALAACQDAASSKAATTRHSAGSGAMTPAQIYNTAKSLLPADDGIFDIHHARAVILLSLVNLGRSNLTAAWLLIGKAVRIYLEVSSRDRVGHEKQSQRFRSVFIACFILDTMVSQQSGKPPHLTPDDMAHAANIAENDLDEWQPWAACEGFGEDDGNFRSSRNPAYCLSTFNQVYSIFKVIGRDIARKRAGMEYDRASAVGLPQLQRAININAPFGAYILSSGVGSGPVPSPYLLKIIYLWGTGLLDAISISTARLMIAIIEEYQIQFGACAMPPFLAACLASWSSRSGFDGLDPQDKVRLSALGEGHAALWDSQPTVSPHTYHELSRSRGAHFAYHNTDQTDQRPTAVLPPLNPAVPAPSYTTSGLPTGSSSRGHGSHNAPVSSPYLLSSYGNARELLRPVVPVMSGDTATDPTSNVRIVAEAHHAASTLQPSYLLPSHSSSLTGAPISADYDAILDDLASIDYADRVETDPQFMVNLGFAPGCDLNEVLSLDFARF